MDSFAGAGGADADEFRNSCRAEEQATARSQAGQEVKEAAGEVVKDAWAVKDAKEDIKDTGARIHEATAPESNNPAVEEPERE